MENNSIKETIMESENSNQATTKNKSIQLLFLENLVMAAVFIPFIVICHLAELYMAQIF